MKKLDEETDFVNLVSVLGVAGTKPQVVAAPPAPPPVPTLTSRAFNRIPFDDYLFGLTFCQGNQNMGTVFVRPNSDFYRPFIKSLARFCQPQVSFEGQIVKV